MRGGRNTMSQFIYPTKPFDGLLDRLTSPDGLKTATLTDTNLVYQDGIRDRLVIDSTKSSLVSPDAVAEVLVANNAAIIKYDGDNKIHVSKSITYMYGKHGNTNNRLKLSGSDFEQMFLGVVRLNVNATDTYLQSPDTLQKININNTAATYNNSKILTEADKGTTNGIAELVNGIVPTSQLPSYVDEVVEYASLAALITADPQGVDKIYIALDTNKIYRYSGTPGNYVEISASVVLGTTSSTAYRGDRGLIAYTHSLSGHAPSDANNYTHPTGDGNSHVPANSTTNNGKVLTAGATAGLYTWETPVSGDIDDRIISGDTTHTLIIDNTSLVMNDGVRNRVEINATGNANISPNGTNSIIVQNTGAFYNAVEIATLNDLNANWDTAYGWGDHSGTYSLLNHNHDTAYSALGHTHTDLNVLTSPDTLNSITLTNLNLKYNQGASDRLIVDANGSGLHSPDGNQNLLVTNTYASYNGVEIATLDDIYSHPTGDGNKHVPANGTTNDGNVLVAGATAGTYTWETPPSAFDEIVSPDTLSNMKVTNTDIKYNDGTVDRLAIGATATTFKSPDGLTGLTVINDKTEIAKDLDVYGSATFKSVANIKRADGLGKGILKWTDGADVRTGWVGFGTSADKSMSIRNETPNADIVLWSNSGRVIVRSDLSTERFVIDDTFSTIYSPDRTRFAQFLNGQNNRTSHAWDITSDRRLKNTIEDLGTTAIDFINNLKPKSYELNDTPDKTSMGFIAQEVEGVQISDIVQTDEEGMKSLAYTDIISPLVAYVQDLQAQINGLKQ